jgi:hypothetical protein
LRRKTIPLRNCMWVDVLLIPLVRPPASSWHGRRTDVK